MDGSPPVVLGGVEPPSEEWGHPEGRHESVITEDRHHALRLRSGEGHCAFAIIAQALKRRGVVPVSDGLPGGKRERRELEAGLGKEARPHPHKLV